MNHLAKAFAAKSASLGVLAAGRGQASGGGGGNPSQGPKGRILPARSRDK